MEYRLTIEKYEGDKDHKECVLEFSNWDEARSAFDAAAETMLMFSQKKMSLIHMNNRFLVCNNGSVVLKPIE